MRYPEFNIRLNRRQAQSLQIMGINLTDNYQDGQMESCKGISTERYPYISTRDMKELVDTGIPDGYQPISIYAWEKLFVVSNEPSPSGGYKCYYGGTYCGDAANTDLPKQYAVVNSKLVMFPDQVYFNLYDKEMKSYPLTTAAQLGTIISGTVTFRKAAT